MFFKSKVSPYAVLGYIYMYSFILVVLKLGLTRSDSEHCT